MIFNLFILICRFKLEEGELQSHGKSKNSLQYLNVLFCIVARKSMQKILHLFVTASGALMLISCPGVPARHCEGEVSNSSAEWPLS